MALAQHPINQSSQVNAFSTNNSLVPLVKLSVKIESGSIKISVALWHTTTPEELEYIREADVF